MLMPEERKRAIDILVQNTQNNSVYYNGSTMIADMLRNGHKGYAAYTDLELMRACQALAKKTNAHEVVSFVTQIAAEKFILE